jgi:hypothetical protein
MNPATRTKIGVVPGSSREQRLGERVIRWVLTGAKEVSPGARRPVARPDGSMVADPCAYPGRFWVAGQMGIHYAPKGRADMLPPFLFSKQHRSDEEVAEWEAQQAKLGKDYDSPWLSSMVTFSGFVAAFIGSFAILLIVANLRHGTVWVPYTVILAALVAGHLCLRALLYKRRRRARQRNVPAHKDSSARSVP